MDGKKKDTVKEILFGYLCTPACGWQGKDDGGFSVAVYADGRLVHKTYIFCDIDKTTTEYKISDVSVSKIKALLEKYQADIDAFDEHLNNGSCDGEGNFFVFHGKEIITWNIRHVSVWKLRMFNRDYYKEYLPVVRQENKILLLFFAAAKILKKDGVRLSLDKVSFGG